MAQSNKVIDLTLSSDDDLPAASVSRKRKRGSRGKDSAANTSQDQPSADQLFYTDSTPDINAISHIVTGNIKLNGELQTVEIAPLLLPSHVSVIGDADVVQIEAPSPPSDEQYIEYLEYDGKVCLYTNHVNSTLIKINRTCHPSDISRTHKRSRWTQLPRKVYAKIVVPRFVTYHKHPRKSD